jgi:ATP-dependent Clp protease ATP-binding subunit ClpA
LAQRIIAGNVPDKLKGKKIFLLDMGTLVAGTKYRGEFESRMKAILEEATDPTNNIILFIDELHTII